MAKAGEGIHLDATGLQPGEEALSSLGLASVGVHVEQGVHGVDVGAQAGSFHQFHQALPRQDSQPAHTSQEHS